jgi:hypothetical protein
MATARRGKRRASMGDLWARLACALILLALLAFLLAGWLVDCHALALSIGGAC